MKSEDLERLKKLLKGTEFEIENTYIDYAFVAVNEWEGVDFVECKTDRSDIFKRGKVYRLVPEKDIEGKDCIYDSKNIEGSAYGFGGTKKNFKPSTEEAYFDQLKAKAFELYGEIKDKDVFQFPEQIKCSISLKSKEDSSTWNYTKICDNLWLNGFILYKKGQWAKKLPKRIEVFVKNYNWNNEKEGYVFDYSFKIRHDDSAGKNVRFSGEFLAKQLEDYLNK